MYSKTLPNFDIYIHLIFTVLFTSNVVAFESGIKFRFSTSYDLKTVKLPSHPRPLFCCELHFRMKRLIEVIDSINKKGVIQIGDDSN